MAEALEAARAAREGPTQGPGSGEALGDGPVNRGRGEGDFDDIVDDEVLAEAAQVSQPLDSHRGPSVDMEDRDTGGAVTPL